MPDFTLTTSNSFSYNSMSSAVIFFLGFFSTSSSPASFSSSALHFKFNTNPLTQGHLVSYFSNNLRADLIFLFCFWVSSFFAFFNAFFKSLRAWYYNTLLVYADTRCCNVGLPTNLDSNFNFLAVYSSWIKVSLSILPAFLLWICWYFALDAARMAVFICVFSPT